MRRSARAGGRPRHHHDRHPARRLRGRHRGLPGGRRPPGADRHRRADLRPRPARRPLRGRSGGRRPGVDRPHARPPRPLRRRPGSPPRRSRGRRSSCTAGARGTSPSPGGSWPRRRPSTGGAGRSTAAWTARPPTGSSPPRTATALSVGPGRDLVMLETTGHARHHMSVHDEATGTVFAGDAAGARLAGGGLYPTMPPPDVDLDRRRRAASTGSRRWRPARLCLPHFGPVPTRPPTWPSRPTSWAACARRRPPAPTARPCGAPSPTSCRSRRRSPTAGPSRSGGASAGPTPTSTGLAGLARATVTTARPIWSIRREDRSTSGSWSLTVRRRALEALLVRLPGNVWALPGAAVGPGRRSRRPRRGRSRGRPGCAGSGWSSSTPSTATAGSGVSVAHLALAPAERHPPTPGPEVVEVRWFPLADLPALDASDARILDYGRGPRPRQGRLRAHRPRPAARGLHPRRAPGRLRGRPRPPPRHPQLPARRAGVGRRGAARAGPLRRPGPAGAPVPVGRR